MFYSFFSNTNGADKIMWKNNNGVFSNIPNPE